jgi:hypothetical protein
VARVIGLWQLLQVGLGGPGLGIDFGLCAFKGMLEGKFRDIIFRSKGMFVYVTRLVIDKHHKTSVCGLGPFGARFLDWLLFALQARWRYRDPQNVTSPVNPKGTSGLLRLRAKGGDEAKMHLTW